MKRALFIFGLLVALGLVFTANAQPNSGGGPGLGPCGQGYGPGDGPGYGPGGGPGWGPPPCCQGGQRGWERGSCCEQMRGRPGPMGREHRGMHRGHRYDPATVKTVEGEVARVMKPEGPRGRRGVMVWMETKDDFIPVFLGPAKFLKKADVKLEKGNRIIVSGSEVKGPGGPAMIAKEFRKDDKLVTLRDDDGTPKWSPRNRHDD
jgi:hypothetical protein